MPDTQQEYLARDIKTWIEQFGCNRNNLILILQEIQKKYSQVSDFAMQVLADCLAIPATEVFSIVSFYPLIDDRPKGRFAILLCRSISCDMRGKDNLAEKIMKDLDISFGQTTADGLFSLDWLHCLGMCDQGPNIMVNGQIFTHVDTVRLDEIIGHCRESGEEKVTDRQEDLWKLATSSSGGALTFKSVEPGRGLKAALEKHPRETVESLHSFQIKENGKSEQPLWEKWKYAASTPGSVESVICNACQAEPGSFKERVILMNYCHLVFEGMAIGGYISGAQKGILYLRGEHACLSPYLESRLQESRSNGMLGKAILGNKDFDFDIEIRLSPGGYIIGKEETAMIESLAGNRAEPQTNLPYSVRNTPGQNNCLVNHVETYAWVASILAKGGGWLKPMGEDGYTLPGIYAVSGDCEKPGVYEFSSPVTIQQILETAGGSGAKAVQMDGACGKCVPSSQFWDAIDPDEVADNGSIIVFGQERNMLKAAKNFLEFFNEESCGQCIPCRDGNAKLLEGINLLLRRRNACSRSFLLELCSLAETMRLTSRCSLGQSSPNAFLSTLEHFPRG